MSLAVFLAQLNHVTAVNIIPGKVNLINKRISPIQDEYIKSGSYEAEFVIIASPTNYRIDGYSAKGKRGITKIF